VGGAELAALQQAQAMAESVAGELAMARNMLEGERAKGGQAAAAQPTNPRPTPPNSNPHPTPESTSSPQP